MTILLIKNLKILIHKRIQLMIISYNNDNMLNCDILK